MKNVALDLGTTALNIQMPDSTDILSMGNSAPLHNPESAIRKALDSPIGTPPLEQLVRRKLENKSAARAVVVISDNTRPVPYKGSEGILWPIITTLRNAGLADDRIKILIATGTHHAMTETTLRRILDPRIFEASIPIVSHDCRDTKSLARIGSRKRLGDILVNRLYIDSDIKILTGLVESHFMAGVSGGRKAICPGLIGEQSTYLIHSGPILASPEARDLVLDGNPVHEEALAVARLAGCDFIVNVTLDPRYRLCGVFAGDMEKAHLKAVERLKNYVTIPARKKYDMVVSHGGYVGINHYQTAKAGVICSSILKKNGLCILAARHTDSDPVGTDTYKKMLRLLNEWGPDLYEAHIKAPDWTFVPDQWEPQMWARLFHKIPPDNLLYCCEEIPEKVFSWIPGRDGRTLVPGTRSLEAVVQGTADWALKKLEKQLNHKPSAAVLQDGPYGIPVPV